VSDELDEIRRRLDTLERRVNSAAGLRAMMDLDQASLTSVDGAVSRVEAGVQAVLGLLREDR
jgi:hypothetical protein